MNLSKYKLRTDLAFEAIDLDNLRSTQGIVDDEQVYKNITLKRTIINESATIESNRSSGIYYCLDSTNIASHDNDGLEDLEDALTFVLKDILKVEGIDETKKGLVVGLGNISVTPDALGPMVTDNIIVSRHMFILEPNGVSEGISNVCALAPGVMGTTGIETYDIIMAVIDKIQIDYIIVVDALAARSITRVNKTIQVTNAGIAPGSGVGNSRKELSRKTTGRPVIAIGVPTVVDAVTIASDTVDYLLRYFNQKLNPTPKEKLVSTNAPIDLENTNLPPSHQQEELLGIFGTLDEEEKRKLFEEVLSPNGYNMMVTPKEIDLDIENIAKVISGSIDRALHKAVNHN